MPDVDGTRPEHVAIGLNVFETENERCTSNGNFKNVKENLNSLFLTN
jgi:hypothetical protein